MFHNNLFQRAKNESSVYSKRYPKRFSEDGGGGDHDALFPSADPLWSKHEILFSLSTDWNGPEHCNKSTLGVEIIKVFSRCNRGSLVMSLPPKHTHNPIEVSATLAQ